MNINSEITFHPAANIFPMLLEPELYRLAEDINGIVADRSTGLFDLFAGWEPERSTPKEETGSRDGKRSKQKLSKISFDSFCVKFRMNG